MRDTVQLFRSDPPFGRTPPLNGNKPRTYNYTHSDKVDPPEPWQIEDIEHMYQSMLRMGKTAIVTTGTGFINRPAEIWSLLQYAGCANWSEMGAKKTSTGLWLIQRYCREFNIENPNVLAISTRSGKGTFFQLAPHILEGWTIINVNTQSLSIVTPDGKEQMIPPSKLKFVPEKFNFPCLVVCHYQMFSRSNKGEFVLDDEGKPVKEENGAIRMKELTQADRVVKRPWDLRWTDEAHRMKDRNAKWTVVLNRGNKDPKDAEEKFDWAYWDFFEEFIEINDDDGVRRIVGVKPEKKQEFRALVRKFGPRRTLDEVMPHLKKPIFVERKIILNAIQRKMYDELKTMLRTLDQQGEPIHSPNVLALLQRLRGICVATPEVAADYFDERLNRRVQKVKLVEPSSKLDEVMNILDELSWDEDEKQPVVIFSNFVGPLKLLQARLEKANRNAIEMGFEPEYPYLWMKAEDDDNLRYEKWARLFPSMQYKIFMSTVQLGGESINLTPARHCVFLDRSWSPKDNMQAIGRIRRPGQEGQPVVIHINARNTTDGYVKAVNELKQGWFDEIFGAEEE